MSKSPIDEFLLSAQAMIENSIADPSVKAALAVYGYTEEKLLAGKALYTEAAALQNTQIKEYGDQVAATAELNTLWEKADYQYMKTLKIARVAFQESVHGEKAALLFGSRNRSLSGWLKQTQAFYDNLQKESSFLTALSQFGYTVEKLQQESDLVNQVAEQYHQQLREIGEAQKATQIRDRKIDELAKWISDLRAVAKVALAEDDQQLEKLGILARTSKISKSHQ